MATDQIKASLRPGEGMPQPLKRLALVALAMLTGCGKPCVQEFDAVQYIAVHKCIQDPAQYLNMYADDPYAGYEVYLCETDFGRYEKMLLKKPKTVLQQEQEDIADATRRINNERDKEAAHGK